MNFGLESYVPYALYLLAITSLLLSIFWRPITGLFFLLPLLPLQTIRYRINDLPLGGSLIGVMLVGIAIGLARQGKPVLPKSNWTPLIGVYGIFTYVSLWLGSIYLNDEFPLPGSRRFGTWQEYMVMPALLLIVAALKPTKKEMQAIVALICRPSLSPTSRFGTPFPDPISVATATDFARKAALSAMRELTDWPRLQPSLQPFSWLLLASNGGLGRVSHSMHSASFRRCA